MILDIRQDYKIVSTRKTVEWLVSNTSVSTFDSVKFEGYQRKVDAKHCDGIVNYLKDNFLMPNSIICACENYNDDMHLRIVDGQHRVEAFKILQRQNKERFLEISKYEMPVTVLVGVPIEIEIDTFITINKTSKKVDTSLAFVLRNIISRKGENMAMSKAEYISVEIARILNENEENELWANRILYEGAIKQTDKYISLNSFVRATRIFVNTIYKKGILDINWNTQDDALKKCNRIAEVILAIWNSVYQKWPQLRNAQLEDKQILQGSIGYTAITRTLVYLMREELFKDIDQLTDFLISNIKCFDVEYDNWLHKGTFSKFSSESGYKYVSDVLLKSMK